jgi:acetyl esterase/lipase
LAHTTAPEWPFPAAPEDVKDIIDYVLKNKEGYLDTSRVVIGGFSAGGTLALTAGASQPKGVLKGKPDSFKLRFYIHL